MPHRGSGPICLGRAHSDGGSPRLRGLGRAVQGSQMGQMCGQACVLTRRPEGVRRALACLQPQHLHTSQEIRVLFMGLLSRRRNLASPGLSAATAPAQQPQTTLIPAGWLQTSYAGKRTAWVWRALACLQPQHLHGLASFSSCIEDHYRHRCCTVLVILRVLSCIHTTAEHRSRGTRGDQRAQVVLPAACNTRRSLMHLQTAQLCCKLCGKLCGTGLGSGQPLCHKQRVAQPEAWLMV